jgi:hypothetical protein
VITLLGSIQLHQLHKERLIIVLLCLYVLYSNYIVW